jgi:hypothetical protein
MPCERGSPRWMTAIEVKAKAEVTYVNLSLSVNLTLDSKYNIWRKHPLRPVWRRIAQKAVLLAYGKSALYPMTGRKSF